ncbi:hypothetical protein [Brachybacterium sp. FME24]|uniref:hypothetical protein n=1 Tax=Brachybacterium sp. FME24 TaxID=2742605 RepID=UPI00271558F1|nr:hypothetical protein [Brachybacterium sp. FME24]
MSDESPWAPRSAAEAAPSHESSPPSAAVPAPAPESTGDATAALGLAVVLLALAGISALLGEHFLLGALRLTAGILTGAGAGVLALTLLRPRLASRPRRLVAGGLALAVALALTAPAVLATRLDPLEDSAQANIAALGEGDTVHSVPGTDAPVLVRRADGTAQLLRTGQSIVVHSAPEEVVALSADGRWLVQVTGATTRVAPLSAEAGAGEEITLDGSPLALSGDVIVLRHCEEADAEAESCRLSGYDLTDPAQALWTVAAPAQARGIDPAGVDVPARPQQAPGLLDAARATGVLPAVPLRFDPAQGWLQLDPATGFPVGRVLAGADQECRVTATGPAPTAAQTDPLVLTVCSDDGGALTATAHVRGEVLWVSEPSPAGVWSVRMGQGRVLATGTEEGTGEDGEIVASEHRAAWTEPGAGALDEAVDATARLGIDGARMVLVNESGQLVAYDTADGTNTWTLPAPRTPVTGTLEAATAVALDPVERTRSLEPRGAQRLRVIDAATGDVTHDSVVAGEVRGVHGVGDGRALVTLGDRTVLLGP